jgi:hypothetical protein
MTKTFFGNFLVFGRVTNPPYNFIQRDYQIETKLPLLNWKH